MRDKHKAIVDRILSTLIGLTGFGDWWFNIKEETRKELYDELVNDVKQEDEV